MRAKLSGKAPRAIAALVVAVAAAAAATQILGGTGGARAAFRKGPRWKLVFADDFSQGLDRSRWLV